MNYISMGPRSLSFTYTDNDAATHALVWLGTVQFNTSNTI